MKNILILSLLLAIGGMELAAQKLPGLDKSPLDISVWRAERGAPVATKVVYSRPFAKGREIWGGLIPYGTVWRTGANEAPEIIFYQDVIFGGKLVKAGTYTLFTLVEKGKMTAILNSELNQWGTYSYNKDKDVVRIPADVVEKTTSPVENFTIVFDNQEDGSTHMVLAWGNRQARFRLNK